MSERVQANPAWGPVLSRGKVDAVMSVMKKSSRNKYQPRVLLVRDPHLLLLSSDTARSITRILSFDQIERIQSSGAEVLIRPTPGSKERDWLFRWQTGDIRNTHRNPRDVLELIARLRRPYTPGWDLLALEPAITLAPKLTLQHGGKTAKETYEILRKKKGHGVRRYPNPSPEQQQYQPQEQQQYHKQEQYQQYQLEQPPPAASPVPPALTLTLHQGEQDFGFQHHAMPGEPVRIVSVTPGGAAHRAGLQDGGPPVDVVKINGEPLLSGAHLQEVLQQVLRSSGDTVVLETAPGDPSFVPPPPGANASLPGEYDSLLDTVTSSVLDTSQGSAGLTDDEEEEAAVAASPPPPPLPVPRKRRSRGGNRSGSTFWRNFVASYDAQAAHWRKIESDVVGGIDRRLSSQTYRLDFETEAILMDPSNRRLQKLQGLAFEKL